MGALKKGIELDWIRNKNSLKMKFAEQIERLQYLDKQIRKKATGPPEKLAKKIGLSRSQLYNLIGYLNDIGMDVRFSRRRNSFYYTSKKKKIKINFSIKIISEENEHTIYGGGYIFANLIQMEHEGCA
jgi:biotin operon repressor